MIGELLPTGYTYNTGRIAINDAFSGEASFNVFSAETMYSGSTDLYDIFATDTENVWSSGTGTASAQIKNANNLASGNYSIAAGNTNTASGEQSIVIGGQDSTVSGDNSVILGSRGCVATHDYSVILGGLSQNSIADSTIHVPNLYSVASISGATFYSGSTDISNLLATATFTVDPFTGLTDDVLIYWDVDNSTNAEVILTGASGTLAVSGMSNGSYGTLKVIQDAVGSRSMSLPANSKVVSGGGGALTFTTNADAEDIISFTFDGVNFYWNVGYNYS